MATTLEIIRGISQALAYSYDGAHDARYTDDGEAHAIGLKREEGDPILDSRVMDGFKVKISGNRLCIHYHAEVRLKDVHDSNFEADTEEMIDKIAAFIKKEYKKVTGDTLSLSAEGEVDVLVQNTSKVRVFVTGKKNYKVGNLDGVLEVGLPSEDRLDKSIRDFISLGKQ